jgi:hypothetical protein
MWQPRRIEGSREATTGNKLRLRIKDFAAYYLSKIENIAVQLPRSWSSTRSPR